MGKIKSNLNNLTLALALLVYAIDLFLRDTTYIRILEPPARYVLIAVMLVVSILNILGVAFSWQKTRGLGLIGIAGCWSGVSYLYWVNPVSNGGWTLTLALTVITLTALYRGDFSDGQ